MPNEDYTTAFGRLLPRPCRLPSKYFVKFVHVICEPSAETAEETLSISNHGTRDAMEASRHHYAVKHSKCAQLLRDGNQNIQIAHRLQMSLIRVCRKIHHKAALVPYSTNTFAFVNGKTLEWFVRRSLLALQRSAIISLQIAGSMVSWATYKHSEAAAKILTGLKTLEVAPGVELFAGSSYPVLYCFPPPPFQMSTTGLETLFASLPKDFHPEHRKTLRKLAARWLHRS